jgi:hypothetical protein
MVSDDVLASGNERTSRQLENQHLIEGRNGFEVEAVQALGRT